MILFKQIYVHTEGHEVLQNYFPKEMLPRDYGGKESTREDLNGKYSKLF